MLMYSGEKEEILHSRLDSPASMIYNSVCQSGIYRPKLSGEFIAVTFHSSGVFLIIVKICFSLLFISVVTTGFFGKIVKI